MKNTWFISDTHFNHAPLLEFVDWNDTNKLIRPGFKNIEHMNETIIENWNKVVKPNDIVWHLGDVIFGLDKTQWLEKNWPRLNGKKYLTIGNHDNIKFLSPFFKEIVIWKEFHDHGFIATHIPLHKESMRRQSSKTRLTAETPYLNLVHGHIHQNETYEKWMRCVSVEQTNYTPIHIDELF